MMRSLYTAATGMEAQQTKMDVIAHNLANSGTTGFKKSRAEFEDLLSETIRAAAPPTPQGGSQPAPLQVGLGVRSVATTRSLAQGDMIGTHNPLDLAIEGAGYFKIQRPNGEFAYTRAGNFRVDATGRIVHDSTHPLGSRLYPTTVWAPGTLVREHLALLIPSTLAPSRYRLYAQVIDENTQQSLSAGVVFLGTVQVTRAPKGA